MTSLPYCAASAVAALLFGVATPVYGNGNNCGFDAAGTVGLSFGTLDPSSAATKTVAGSISVGYCLGANTMILSVDSGQNGNRNMIRSGGTELIPYTISAPSFSPGNAAGPGNNATKVATFTGTVQASAYIDAVAGSYSDTLIISVTP